MADDSEAKATAPAAPAPAKSAKSAKSAKPAAGSSRTKHIVTGAAIGIGSAALVAALLYANRSRKSDGS
jgi:hypothetical protein